MKVNINGYPEFAVPLKYDHVAILMKLSDSHYDATCRTASVDRGAFDMNGFLFNWANQLKYYAGATNPLIPPIKIKWREMDICMKIMEAAPLLPPSEKAIIQELQATFNGAMHIARSAMLKWTATYDSEGKS